MYMYMCTWMFTSCTSNFCFATNRSTANTDTPFGSTSVRTVPLTKPDDKYLPGEFVCLCLLSLICFILFQSVWFTCTVISNSVCVDSNEHVLLLSCQHVGPASYQPPSSSSPEKHNAVFASSTKRLHSPPPIVTVWYYVLTHTHIYSYLRSTLYTHHVHVHYVPSLVIKIWLVVWVCTDVHVYQSQDIPPPGSYEVTVSYQKTHGKL